MVPSDFLGTVWKVGFLSQTWQATAGVRQGWKQEGRQRAGKVQHKSNNSDTDNSIAIVAKTYPGRDGWIFLLIHSDQTLHGLE